jgi:hypothetical protein
MFGSGLYLADCATKAAGYAKSGQFGYMFLCEVALGRSKYLKVADPGAQRSMNTHDSVMVHGRYGLLKAK